MTPSTPHDPRQRVLVFGASGGIGSALCELLHRRGAQLAVAGRDEAKLRALSQSCDAVALPGDLREADTVAATFQGAQEALGGLDAVVQLVGSVLLKPAHLIDDESFEDCLQTNLWSAFRVLRESAKAMRKGGSVCLMSTVAVQTGLPNHEAISAAKGGVEGLVRAAAASYAPRKLRVNAVAPGLVETPMTSFLTERDEARAESEDLHPLGRLGQPDEIARAIDFLIQPGSDWVTGQVLHVDGGMGALRHRRRRR